jgi:hypothetical protein
MVNMRATFAAAVREGVLEPALAGELTDIAKGMFYKERTYAAVLSGCAVADPRHLADWLPAGRVDQKLRDAKGLLAIIRAHLAATPEPLRVTYRLANTAAWEAARGHTSSE